MTKIIKRFIPTIIAVVCLIGIVATGVGVGYCYADDSIIEQSGRALKCLEKKEVQCQVVDFINYISYEDEKVIIKVSYTDFINELDKWNDSRQVKKVINKYYNRNGQKLTISYLCFPDSMITPNGIKTSNGQNDSLWFERRDGRIVRRNGGIYDISEYIIAKIISSGGSAIFYKNEGKYLDSITMEKVEDTREFFEPGIFLNYYLNNGKLIFSVRIVEIYI